MQTIHLCHLLLVWQLFSKVMNYIHEGNHAYSSHISFLYNTSMCGMREVKAAPATWAWISLITEGLQAWGFAETCTYFNHFKSSCPWLLLPSTSRWRKWWHPPTNSSVLTSSTLLGLVPSRRVQILPSGSKLKLLLSDEHYRKVFNTRYISLFYCIEMNH